MTYNKAKSKTVARSVVVCGKERFMQKNLFTIGIITDQMQYIEHEIIVMKHCATNYTASRLNKLFSLYQFDKYTDICIADETLLDSALVIHLKILAGNYGIQVENLHDAAMLLRLVTVHSSLVGRKWKQKYLERWKIDKSRNLTSSNISESAVPTLFKKLWNTFLRKNVCPWIDSDVDLSIELGQPKFKKQRKRVRLAAYYLVCRRYFKLKHQRIQA